MDKYDEYRKEKQNSFYHLEEEKKRLEKLRILKIIYLYKIYFTGLRG